MIKKSECLATLDIRESAQYNLLISEIDEALKKYNYFTITVSIPDNVGRKVLDRIVKEYSVPDAGWKVTKHDDQNEGAWLAFE